MPCPHYDISIVSRANGGSAVVRAAYQSGEKLFSEYDQQTKYYHKKEGEVVLKEILLPEYAPPEYADRNVLWNAVEAVESQWNSQLARRLIIALPRELPLSENLKLIRQYCDEQFRSKGMVADLCVHDPNPPGHNPHAHVLLTLRSIDKNGQWIRTKFNYWLLYGDYTTDGDVFDAGVTTCTALKKGKPAIGEWDNGNGSLMRVLPLAFVDCTDDEIRAVSAITHGHWISEEACVIYVHVAKRLLAGETISSIIPTLRFDKPFDRLYFINTVDRTQIKSSGYVVDTLEAALWAVSHEGDWEKGFRNDILTAVNLGSDTDTVVAVAGGLAGIIYGLDDVQDWAEKLQNREEIERYLF